MTLLTPAQRVLARTVPGPGGCLLFEGAKDSHGYGKIGVHGTTKAAHRVIFGALCGPLPDGAVVRHRCDVRACVNPDHLEAGSFADNTQDMLERDRHPEHMRRRETCSRGHDNWGTSGAGVRRCRSCTADRQRLATGGRARDLLHCRNGHLYDAENTRWQMKGGYRSRVCRQCQSDRMAEFKARQLARVAR